MLKLPISVGGINSLLERLTRKALPYYEQIKKRIRQSAVAGTDETSVMVNGQNWVWTWQNDRITFLVYSDNRGGRTIEQQFPNGLPLPGLVHDRYACHFNYEAFYYQICMAHVLRDLKYIIQLYDGKCEWAMQMKALISEALELKKLMVTIHYFQPNDKRNELVEKLEQLLQTPLHQEHSKAATLQKNLVKHQESMLNFLWYHELPLIIMAVNEG